MYIISKNKDYYDGVVNTTGIDKSIVYNRQTIELDMNDPNFPKIFKNSNSFINRKDDNPFNNLKTCSFSEKYCNFSPFVIGFCGKIFVGYFLFEKIKTETMIKSISYDINYLNKYAKKYYWGGHGNFLDLHSKINNYDLIPIFREFSTPIFVLQKALRLKDIDFNQESKFIVNPILKDFEFYKVYNSYQAFQEIQMFLGGVLGSNENKIIEIDDKYKIEQHGFDLKWSFRKEPKKK